MAGAEKWRNHTLLQAEGAYFLEVGDLGDDAVQDVDVMDDLGLEMGGLARLAEDGLFLADELFIFAVGEPARRAQQQQRPDLGIDLGGMKQRQKTTACGHVARVPKESAWMRSTAMPSARYALIA